MRDIASSVPTSCEEFRQALPFTTVSSSHSDVWMHAWEAQNKSQGRTLCVLQLERWAWWTCGDQWQPSMRNTTGQNGSCFALSSYRSEGRHRSRQVQNAQRNSACRTQQSSIPLKWDGPHQRGSSSVEGAPHSTRQRCRTSSEQGSTVGLAAWGHSADVLAVRNRSCSASWSDGCREHTDQNPAAGARCMSTWRSWPSCCNSHVRGARLADVPIRHKPVRILCACWVSLTTWAVRYLNKYLGIK